MAAFKCTDWSDEVRYIGWDADKIDAGYPFELCNRYWLDNGYIYDT